MNKPSDNWIVATHYNYKLDPIKGYLNDWTSYNQVYVAGTRGAGSIPTLYDTNVSWFPWLHCTWGNMRSKTMDWRHQYYILFVLKCDNVKKNPCSYFSKLSGLVPELQFPLILWLQASNRNDKSNVNTNTPVSCMSITSPVIRWKLVNNSSSHFIT